MSPPRPHEDDDGATTIRTGPSSGLNSDFVTSSMYIGDSLPEGLRLGEYEILSVIGEGGFGIVYLAYDHFLQRQVALKEYMPSSLAGRSRMGLEVTIKSERHRDTFAAGLKSFINEARLLAQFDHRALVKVYRFWEGNGTAYMVMPYVVGPTLKAALAEMPGAPSEAWLRDQVLTPLMEALALLHKASCLHRDIAPDNILLTETGPMLLDFGAARKVIGDLNQTLTVVLKPGYAPIEQYGEVPALTQGPWTDVYALGGVVRYAITGKVPVSATTRLVQDTMVPMAQLAAGQYSDAFLQAVDGALAVRPVDRPQDMEQLAARLGAPEASGPGAMTDAELPGAVGISPSSVLPAKGRPQPVTPAHPTTVTKAPVTRAGSVTSPSTVPPEAATRPWPATAEPSAVVTPPSARTGRPLGLWLGGLLIAVAAVVAWLVFKPAATGSSSLPTPAPAEVSPRAPDAVAASGATPAATTQTPPVAPPQATPAEPAVVTPRPTAAAVAPTETAAAPKPVPAPAPRPAQRSATTPVAVTEAPTAQPPVLAPPVRPSPPGGDRASRCSDLLQKASLEPLTASETSFLKTECR